MPFEMSLIQHISIIEILFYFSNFLSSEVTDPLENVASLGADTLQHFSAQQSQVNLMCFFWKIKAFGKIWNICSVKYFLKWSLSCFNVIISNSRSKCLGTAQWHSCWSRCLTAPDTWVQSWPRVFLCGISTFSLCYVGFFWVLRFPTISQKMCGLAGELAA